MLCENYLCVLLENNIQEKKYYFVVILFFYLGMGIFLGIDVLVICQVGEVLFRGSIVVFSRGLEGVFFCIRFVESIMEFLFLRRVVFSQGRCIGYFIIFFLQGFRIIVFFFVFRVKIVVFGRLQYVVFFFFSDCYCKGIFFIV